MPITQIHPTEVTRTPDNIITWNVEGLGEVRNVPYGIPTNIFTELRDDVLENNISIPVFDDKRNILHGFYLDYICIEYTDASIRETDKVNNENLYKLTEVGYQYTGELHNRYTFTPGWHSKPQDEQGRQIARNVGEFEYNGKLYLVISPRNTPLSDETIPTKGIFKGIIVNQDAYDSGISSGAQEEVSVVKEQVLSLVGQQNKI